MTKQQIIIINIATGCLVEIAPSCPSGFMKLSAMSARDLKLGLVTLKKPAIWLLSGCKDIFNEYSASKIHCLHCLYFYPRFHAHILPQSTHNDDPLPLGLMEI